MKNIFLLFGLVLLTGQGALASQTNFVCTGSKESKWTKYFCVYGTLKGPGQIADVTYGTCQGARRDGEEEPIDTVEIAAVQHNPALAATSPQWRNADAFDMSTQQHGPAVFYLAYPNEIARLKVGDKDLRLNCTF
jgi:hypothetical protein